MRTSFLAFLCVSQTLWLVQGDATTSDLPPPVENVSIRVVLLVDENYGKDCDHPLPMAAKLLSTANRTVESINSRDQDGFTIDTIHLVRCGRFLQRDGILGLAVLDACGSPDKVLRLVARELINSPTQTVFISQTLPSSDVSAWLEPTNSYFISLRDPVVFNNLPDNRSRYYHSTSNLQDSLQSMAEVMVELDWEIVSVVYSDNLLGRTSLKLFEDVARENHICIHQSIRAGASLEASLSGSPGGLVYLGTAGTGYFAFQTLSEKVWLATNNMMEDLTVLELFGTVFSVTRGFVNESSTEASNLEELLNSVYEHCKATGKHCMDVETAVTTESIGYTITKASRNQSGRVVGHVTNLIVKKTQSHEFDNLSSKCRNEDEECLSKCRAQTSRDYLYYPGKYNLLVTLPIQTWQSDSNIFGCDEASVSATTLFRSEALMYAMKLRSNKGQYGAIVINSCFNPLRTQQIIGEILSGKRTISWKGNILDAKSIVAVISDYNSATALQVQYLARLLPIPHIGYGASTVLLNDRENFKYFARTNADDGTQAQTMVRLLQKLNDDGHDIKTVNVISSNGTYGRTAAEAVFNELENANICYKLVEHLSDDTNYHEIVDNIYDNYRDVKFTILFADDKYVERLFDAVKGYQNWYKTGHYFLLSDTWGTNADLLSKYHDVVAGSFSFKFSSNFQTNISNHMPNITEFLDARSQNPWRCQLGYMINVNGKIRPRGCFHSKHKHGEPSKAWAEASTESYAVHLIKAIAAVTQGLREYISSNTNCNDPMHCAQVTFYNQTEIKYKSITNVELSDHLEVGNAWGKTEKVFDGTGNGNAGIQIYQIISKVRGEAPFEYFPLATVNPSNIEIKFHSIRPAFGNGDRNLVSDDGDCFANKKAAPLTELEIALISLLIIFIIATSGIIIFCLIRARRSRVAEDHPPVADDNYTYSSYEPVHPPPPVPKSESCESKIKRWVNEGSSQYTSSAEKTASDDIAPSASHTDYDRPNPRPGLTNPAFVSSHSEGSTYARNRTDFPDAHEQLDTYDIVTSIRRPAPQTSMLEYGMQSYDKFRTLDEHIGIGEATVV